MANVINKLSYVHIANAQKPGRYGDGGGLWLQVSKTGGKYWTFRYMLRGQPRELGLGSHDYIGLSGARRAAEAMRLKLATGIDPYQERQATQDQEARRVSFTECAYQYIEAHKEGWTNAKARDQWTNTLATYAEPLIGKMCVADIETSHIMKVLTQPARKGKDDPEKPFWHCKTETASRVRGRMKAVLGWAATMGYRPRENPAAWGGHLETLLPSPEKIAKTENQPALPYERIGEFMHDLRARSGMAARALEFVILNTVRYKEGTMATWSEFDLAQAHWEIPASRMKARAIHEIPLADQSLALLKALPRREGTDLVFFGSAKKTGALSENTLNALIKRMHEEAISAGRPGYIDPQSGRIAVVHGFRSAFDDWAHEQTKHTTRVIDYSLSHKLKDAVDAAYQRRTLYPLRRRLMAHWARHIDAEVTRYAEVQHRQAA